MKEKEEEDENMILISKKNAIICENSPNKGNEKNNIDGENNIGESEKINIRKIRIIFEIKDHLMLLFLLLSSSVNLSALYLPFIFIGIGFLFLLLKYSAYMNDIKRRIEIFSLVYSILLLIFKGIIFGLIKNETIEYYDYESLFNNIGIRYQKDQNTKRKIFFSLIGEICLIIISFFSLIISSVNKGIDLEKVYDNSFKLKIQNKKILAIMYILYISILVNAIYNKSFITLIYLLSYQFLIIIRVLKIKPYKIIKNVSLFYLICFYIQLIFINILNIYSLQEKLLKKNIIKEGQDIIKVYSIWTMIGINYSYYYSNLTFIYEWISYFACVITIILFMIIQRIFLENNKINENNDIDKDLNDEKDKGKICKKIRFALINFFTNSEFILFFIRILSLIWMSCLRNFFSLGIFAFLFFSFIFDDMNKIHYLVIFILIPIEFITISCLHFSNINGISESLGVVKKNIFSDFAYEKEEYNYKYILVGIYFLFIVIFLNSFYYRKKKFKNNKINPLFSSNDSINQSKEPLLIMENKDIEKIADSEIIEENELYINNNENTKFIDFGLSDLLLKFIYQNIGKLTLITMYFISVHTINIVHFINIIIFMIQILKLSLARKYNKLIIILLQLLFLFEYIIEITKNYYEEFFVDNIKLFEFLLSVSENNKIYSININIEILCYVSIYSFYFENKIINTEKYKQLINNKDINILYYINNKIEKNWKINAYSIITDIVFDIYICLIFFIFFILCCNNEINFLTNLKLFIFFFIADWYFQENKVFIKNISGIRKCIYILIVCCCLSSFIVYFYQLICLDFFGAFDRIKNSNNIIFKNFSSFGLLNYENKNLLFKFLPHFLSNLLPILLLNAINFIYPKIKENEEKNKINNHNNEIINENKNEENFINQKGIIINDDESSIYQNTEENNDSKGQEINIEKLILEENDKNQSTDNENKTNNNINIDIKNISEILKFDYKNIEKIYEKYKLESLYIQGELNSLYIFNSIYLSINFILRLYSPSMILLFSYTFTTSKMSISLIIYYYIICLNFIMMFKKILEKVKYNEDINQKNQLSNHHKTETFNHKKSIQEYNFKIIKSITYITIFFIYGSHLYSIIYNFKFDSNDNKCNNNIEHNRTNISSGIDEIKYGNYVKAIFYILGIYEYSDISGFFECNYLYLLILVFIFISKYTRMIIDKLENKINNNRETIKEKDLKMNYLKTIIAYIKELKNENYQNEKNKKRIIKLIYNYENLEFEDKSISQYLLNSGENNNYIVRKESSDNINLLDLNTLETKLSVFIRVFKRIYEHFLLFAIMSSLFIKMNISSIVYIIIIFLLLKKKNNKNYYIVFKTIVYLTIIQSLILILNINENSLPNIDKEILKNLNDTLSIPLYKKFFGEKSIEFGILLGAGVSRSQLFLIWNENILLFLIYIYLYYFCYSLYNYKNEELDENNKTENNNKNKDEKTSTNNQNENNDKKNIIYQLLSNNELKEEIFNINENDYQKIAEIMKHNFNEEIVSYKKLEDLKNEYIEESNNKSEKISIESKNKEFSNNIPYYILFLFLYYIIFILVLNLSMVCPGFFSAIFICFCLYFLYYSQFIHKGKISKYFINHIILRCIIISDITLQLIVQIIVLFYRKKLEGNNTFDFLFGAIGFREILNEKYEISNNIIFLILKAFCFFCLSLQKYLFSSENFKIYYLSYIIKIGIYSYKQNSEINAKIFNNERIETMNYSLKQKLLMEKSIQKLRKKLKEFSENIENNSIENNYLRIIREESKDSNEDYKEDEYLSQISDSNEENEIEEKIINKNISLDLTNMKTKIRFENPNEKVSKLIIKKMIKKWILSQTFLIKIYSFLDKISFNLFFKSYFKIENMNNKLLKGDNKHIPNILQIINNQLDKLDLSSFNKNDIITLKKFLKELNEIKIQQIEKYINPQILNNDEKNISKIQQDNNPKNEKEKKPKENDEIKTLIKDIKYRQILEIKKSLLFQKYLTKSYLLKKIFMDLIIFISKNFCWICYLFMIINHCINASILSLFYPISIFCYALLENPRPCKDYWRFCYVYTFIILIIKCFSQKIFLGIFTYLETDNTDNTFYENVKIFLDQYPIGIKIYNNIKEYLMNLIFDFLLLICLIVNRIILMLNGLWDHNENYYENIEKAMKRVAFNNIENPNENQADKKSEKNKEKSYYERLFPKLRNEKPGKDFYYYYVFSMILLIFYLLIFYTTMVKDKTYDGVNVVTNQFNGMSIILVLIHLIILIIDRIIYLRQNRFMVTYDYILTDDNGISYSKEDSLKKIKEIFPLFKDNQLISYKDLKRLKEDYFVSIFQKETFNKPLLVKYILHILLTIFSHIFIFFFITMSGNYNIYNSVYCVKNDYVNECNNFQENSATIFFYIIYLFYLIFSALQIKYGFYDVKRKSVFKNVKSIHGILFQIYKHIPFYYPLKNIIDWTVTPTSFDIFNWFRFENIHDEIFKTYRRKYKLKEIPVGQKIKFLCKILCGGLVSIILILLIIIPLILFSTLNPTGKMNNVNSADLKIYMSFVDIQNEEKNILIFENNWARSITNMTEEIWNKYNYSKSYYTKTFPREQTQIISFYSEPENSLSTFKINHMLSSLNYLLYHNGTKPGNDRIVRCELMIEINFMRANPSESRNVEKLSHLKICDILSDRYSEGCEGLDRLYKKLNTSDEYNNTDISFNIAGFIPLVRLGASTQPINVKLEKELNVTLIFQTKGNNLFEIYFEKIEEDNGIKFHVLNEKVSSATFGYSIIGFYSAFILVIGTYIGNFFKYDPSSIIISEMPNPIILLEICEGIKVSRYLHDFKNEEYYYHFLVEILRTPDLIKKLTSSSLKHFENREQLTG